MHRLSFLIQVTARWLARPARTTGSPSVLFGTLVRDAEVSRDH